MHAKIKYVFTPPGKRAPFTTSNCNEAKMWHESSPRNSSSGMKKTVLQTQAGEEGISSILFMPGHWTPASRSTKKPRVGCVLAGPRVSQWMENQFKGHSPRNLTCFMNERLSFLKHSYVIRKIHCYCIANNVKSSGIILLNRNTHMYTYWCISM